VDGQLKASRNRGDGTRATTRRPFDLFTVAVAGTYVDVVGNRGGTRARLYSYWLKLQATPPAFRAGVSARWPDGANFDPREIPIGEGDRIEAAEVGADGVLRVSWRDGTAVQLSTEQLRRAIDNADPADVQPVLWNAETAMPRFDYQRVIEPGDDEQLFRFLRVFLQHGLAFLDNVPRRTDPVAMAAARLSAVRASRRGQTFSVTAAGELQDLGDTCHNIPLHTDMVYKQAPPDLQMLHVLEPADTGGENVFVDAFTVVKQLDPEDVRRLRDTVVLFVAERDTVSFRGLHPVIACDAAGRLRGLHYDDGLVFPVTTPNESYFAFKRLQQLVRRPENAQIVRLPSDSIVLLHNRRTLQGRHGGRGAQRVAGCYLSEDDLKGRYRELARRFQPDETPEGSS
jgi:alpha-ketoglutarate-dependent taurine dioxygenase